MNDIPNKELPKYKCHKEVWALKIKTWNHQQGIVPATRTMKQTAAMIITPAEKGYAPFKVDAEYVRAHNPTTGGYYVVYADGYKSFSPAVAFESGYTLINSVHDNKAIRYLRKKGSPVNRIKVAALTVIF
jgi:hypothetical protein